MGVFKQVTLSNRLLKPAIKPNYEASASGNLSATVRAVSLGICLIMCLTQLDQDVLGIH